MVWLEWNREDRKWRREKWRENWFYGYLVGETEKRGGWKIGGAWVFSPLAHQNSISSNWGENRGESNSCSQWLNYPSFDMLDLLGFFFFQYFLECLLLLLILLFFFLSLSYMLDLPVFIFFLAIFSWASGFLFFFFSFMGLTRFEFFYFLFFIFFSGHDLSFLTNLGIAFFFFWVGCLPLFLF